MASKKCAKCNKNITKTKPGLVCSRCDKSVHADPACVKLSNKLINTLKNSPGIEWSCEDCLQNLSRRSSFLIPDSSDDEFEPGRDIQPLDTRKLVQDISRELKKTFREEIKSLEASMEFVTDQLSTMEQSILKQNGIIKELENINHDLINKNKNLELRVSVLEQGMNMVEQKNLSSSLEIAGLPNIPPSEVPKMVEQVASKLGVDKNDIRSSSRLPGSKDKPGQTLVEMKTPFVRSQWIAAGK
jgi:predicted XRE-type DNA-binding protein